MHPLARLKRMVLFWRPPKQAYSYALLFDKFRSILAKNSEILELMADMGEKLGGDYVFDRRYISSACEQITDLVYKLIADLNTLSRQKYLGLYKAFDGIKAQLEEELAGRRLIPETSYTLPYEVLNRDLTDEVGSKNANLGEVQNVLGLRSPDGFAITTKAFHDFFEKNNLHDYIEEILEGWEAENDAFIEAASREVRQRIMKAELPRALLREISASLNQLRQKYPEEHLSFAVRSSAWEEDSQYTFAGQYASLLNVPEARLPRAYKEVVASAYSPSAWHYRRQKDFQEHEMAMAVACQLMVRPQSSGVLYTLDPFSPQKETILVSATFGLGLPVVGGEIRVDEYELDRTPPHALRGMKVVQKTRMLVAREAEGTDWVEVPEELQQKPCLSSSQLQKLAEAALLIERYYKRPQDVEWAFDEEQELYILQTRPLKISSDSMENVCNISEVTHTAPVIFSGKGTVVQRGIAAGKVCLVEGDEDLKDFPAGSIVVTRHTSPRLARVIRKAQGILTDMGSPTGHMATVAREFRIPTIVDTGIATRVLEDGQEITMDATQNVVYAGMIKELCYYELTEEDVFEDSYEYRLLGRLLKRITPLNLVDPHDKNFRAAGCQTLHDITRFVHEKAVEELILLSENQEYALESAPKRLQIDIPLGLVVIDIGGGTKAEAEATVLTPAEILSVPLQGLLEGLLESGMWGTEPISVDLGSLMSSITRTFSSSLASPEQIGRNLVVISKEYMNLSLRVGYHFNIIDAYISENVNDNYAYFRFLGGVTDVVRRSRRAKLIAEILQDSDFRTEVRGDLVVGRIKKLGMQRMQDKMRFLGGLVAYTRQLDVRMISDQQVSRFYDDFMERIAKLAEPRP